MIGEILLGLVPIIFVITGLIFLLSDLYYFLYGKVIVGKVVAIEKYISRTGANNRSSQLMYRFLVEFSLNGSSFRFFSSGRNYISRQIGNSVSIYSLNSSPDFIRIKSFSVLIFGIVFSTFGFGIGYFLVFKSFYYINVLYSFLIVLVSVSLFYFYLKKKSMGDFSIEQLFKTKHINDADLEGRNIFWNSRELELEKSKNAKFELIITFVFILFYSLIFKVCYEKLSVSEMEILKKFMTEFKGFDQLMEVAKGGPMAGVLFCLVLAPLLLHSIMYSLKRL